MQIPAVKSTQTTAGNKTARKKRWKAILGTIAGICILFSSLPGMQVAAADPLERVTKTVTVTQKIPFGTTYEEDPNYYRGYTEQVKDGSMGEREIQIQGIYEGDTLVKVISIKSRQTADPINAVIRRGSKILKSQTADGSRWKTSFQRPLNGWLSADFYDYHGHNGIDLAAPYGTPVYAAAEGKVILAGWYGEYGQCVMIEHADGSQTLYGHNSRLVVRNGQTVKQGEKIAEVGSTGNSTGNHVHFEIRVDGEFLDPLIYMDQ